MLFQVQAGDSAAARAISPARWKTWYDSTIHARLFLPDLPQVQGALDRDVRLLQSLTVALANELYKREHGGEDAPSYEALLGAGYLDSLPPGYADAMDTFAAP